MVDSLLHIHMVVIGRDNLGSRNGGEVMGGERVFRTELAFFVDILEVKVEEDVIKQVITRVVPVIH